jgi:hypothetical protein
MEDRMPRKKLTGGLRAPEEQDIELEVFEEPIDRLFPRLPNVVSRRGHRALKIVVRVQDSEFFPPEAEAVEIDAEVFVYGPDRVGNGQHLFRHRLKWGAQRDTFPLDNGRRDFEIVVHRGLDDDHLGEGPYDATVKVTPQGEGLPNLANPDKADPPFDPDPKVTIRFIAM